MAQLGNRAPWMADFGNRVLSGFEDFGNRILSGFEDFGNRAPWIRNRAPWIRRFGKSLNLGFKISEKNSLDFAIFEISFFRGLGF